MKKIVKILTVIVIAVTGLVIADRLLNKDNRLFMTNKSSFISNAENYLEQKYGIQIEECTYYNEGREGYEPPAFGIDGGYVYSTPQFGIFTDITGKEIVCVNKDGNLSDDYELDELYGLLYEYLSDKLSVDVRHISFTNCGYETNSDGDKIKKNIGMFIERDKNRYTKQNIDVFVGGLFNYLNNSDISIHAYENPDTSDELLFENAERLKDGSPLGAVYIYLYDKNKQLKTKRLDNVTGPQTIDDGDLYKVYLESGLYDYDTMIICNNTGTRSIDKDGNILKVYRQIQ